MDDKPDDFTCAICKCVTSNRFNWSAKDFERPPICRSCETVSGYRWNGGAYRRTAPSGGAFRDRSEALRISALADAIATEANRQQWNRQHGIA